MSQPLEANRAIRRWIAFANDGFPGTLRRLVRRLLASACVLCLSGLPVSARRAGDDPPSLPELLESAGRYAAAFERDFTRVVSDERFQQDLKDSGGRIIRRRFLDSEVYAARVDRQHPWISVRNVLKVNGRTVAATTHAQIKAAFSSADESALRRLQALADAGARYNVGSIRRNFSDPTLALAFLNAELQPRFTFTLRDRGTEDGGAVFRIGYVERQRPTLITGLAGVNLPVSGELVLDDGGRLLRSTLTAGTAAYVTADIRVTFRPDARLGMLVPATLEERYVSNETNRALIVLGQASYANYRRFATAGRMLQER